MKLADISIKRPVFATVMAAVLTVFGVWGYKQLSIDMFPEVELPICTVTAVYPGADPETIESRVVDKLEEAISAVSGIKTLRSTSMESVGLVFVQFELERKADQAVQDVRDKVSAALKNLPADLEPPLVERLDIGAAPVMAIALAGDMPKRELTAIAKDYVKQRFQAINGVGTIDIVGGQEREFHVWIDPQRLDSFGLAPGDVAQAMASQNVEIPGGRLDSAALEMSIKTRGQVHSAEELGNIIITAAGGAPVRIRDVARVEDGEQERRSYATFSGKSSVTMVVRKQSGSNTVNVAHKVKAALEKLKVQFPAVEMKIASDNSVFTERSIDDVKFDLLFGALLAILIIMFFLHDWRATLISATALPVSVISTFAFIQAMGYTLNMMTMLALSLSIGILIDDAIVVIENIHRHLEMGKSPMKAAAEGTAEIGLAVMATTASILAVFVPVATMKGIIGRFFVQFGLTVAFAVSVSLFVAFTLTPMLSSRFLRAHSGKGPIGKVIEGFLDAIERTYSKLLSAALRHRVLTALSAVAVFVASIFLATIVPKEFMSVEDRGQFMVKLEMPSGSSLGATETMAESVATKLRTVPGVEDTLLTIGGSALAEINRAEIQVNLVEKKKRSFSQAQMIDYARTQIPGWLGRADVNYAVEAFNMTGASGGAFRNSMVQFNVRGKNYAEISKATDEIIKSLGEQEVAVKGKKQKAYVDLDVSYRGGKPELAINIDRDRAADLGVPMAVIAMTMRSLMANDKVSEITADGQRYDVRMKLDESFRQKAQDLMALKVRSTTGQLVNLSNVVSIRDEAGPGKIERQNRQRQITVYANLSGIALGEATQQVDALAKKIVPSTMATDWAGQADMMKESMGYLLSALLLAIIIVYLVLAAQFESFLHPFTIMLSLPLSMVGALGALALTHSMINIMTMIGIILLMGLVTKNAILLVDYANTLRRQGMPRRDALLKAGAVRLRPILMTTGAMIFGMLPIALGVSEGGELRAPMAIAVIGGLITSTLLTLVVVPVAYTILDSIAERTLGHATVMREGEETPLEAVARHG
jgi:hydrophobic/amphiphilic exporter-1 (mainly G- bacteria), HAE1 family